jgi:multisubunit Na+/H+ antiporter MnhB subunit
LQEGRDHSVKSSDEIEAIVGMPVIATVSFFESDEQKKKRRYRNLMAASAIALLVVSSSVLAAYIVPLDSLWDTLTDRLVEIGLPIDKK